MDPIAFKPIGLAIDTTFDDTSVAILQGHRRILANLTLSQYADHAEFGGVVPERASRKHLEAMPSLLKQARHQAALVLKIPPPLPWEKLDYLAVSHMPGLIGAILVGMTFAKTLAWRLKKPLIGINHIEAHPYANFLVHGELPFPLLHLVAAGGHTLLIHQQQHFDWKIIGRTLDDAAGECVDKAAKMFGYAIPGGPMVDKLACSHAPAKYKFPKPMLDQANLDFSFSGLKTAMLYYRRDHPNAPAGPALAAFFASICEVLLQKTLRACKQFPQRAVTLSGGLTASTMLRQCFQQTLAQQQIPLYLPPPQLCTDNAAMVACLAARRFEAQRFDSLQLAPAANLPR